MLKCKRRTIKSTTSRTRWWPSRITSSIWSKTSRNLISSFLLLLINNTMRIQSSMKITLSCILPSSKNTSHYLSLTWLISRRTQMLPFPLCLWIRWTSKSSIETRTSSTSTPWAAKISCRWTTIWRQRMIFLRTHGFLSRGSRICGTKKKDKSSEIKFTINLTTRINLYIIKIIIFLCQIQLYYIYLMYF